jgi:hypothetical protein
MSFRVEEAKKIFLFTAMKEIAKQQKHKKFLLKGIYLI